METNKEKKNVQDEVTTYQERDEQSGWILDKCNNCHSYIPKGEKVCPGCKKKIKW